MKTKVIITVVIALLSSVMAWKLYANKQEINDRKEVKTTEESVSVTVATAKLKETSGTLQLVGTAEPSREVMVASEASGKIVQINFKMGDFVTQGTVLAKVDDTYKRLAYENAQMNYNKFKEDYERYQVLRQGDAVSETQLRDMRIGYENAANQLENAKKQLDDTKITAPFSGYITSKNTELGAFVGIGTPIAGIADISQLKVQLAVSESDIYQLRVGMEAVVSTDVLPNTNLKANISSIGQKGSSAHSYPVEIMIANNLKNPLKAGTYVNVSVNANKTSKTLMIPRDAIVSSVKEPSVYIVKDGAVQLTKITTGRQYNSYIEVVTGLNDGEQVVVNGQINLSDGVKVSVIQ
ncbi:MAG: efflux RND transporter periplasmic adaptor subunit [Bacteroidales bacterium]|nr:efflux RND transporter periplasmic adaptor subunit [Bacteroidales bacterium]